MSEILDDYEWSEHIKGRQAKYPWDEWIDGKTRKIVQGEDFTCKVPSMQTLLRDTARFNNMSVRTSVTDEGKAIVFRFSERE